MVFGQLITKKGKSDTQKNLFLHDLALWVRIVCFFYAENKWIQLSRDLENSLRVGIRGP